jgi:hypothetical protein
MAFINKSNLGTQKGDLMVLSNPDQFIHINPEGLKVISVWAGGGNDNVSVNTNATTLVGPNGHIWLYGDPTEGYAPNTPSIGGPMGNDVLHGSHQYKLTGLGGADTFIAHGGHYNRQMYVTDFDPRDGDIIVMDTSDGWDLDTFRFVRAGGDTDGNGSTAILRNVQITGHSDNPITDGQIVGFRSQDQGDGGHHDIWLDYGGRNDRADNQAEAVRQYISEARDGDGFQDWLMDG